MTPWSTYPPPKACSCTSLPPVGFKPGVLVYVSSEIARTFGFATTVSHSQKLY
jgi:hypothetical protein